MPYKDGEKSKEKRRESNRKYRVNNREKIKARAKKYRIKYKEKIKAKEKKYRLENPGKREEYFKKYRLEHKEEIKEVSRKYRQEHEDGRYSSLLRSYGCCQFDGCKIKDRYMLSIHHLFPGDKETIIILCLNHHGLIDHHKEGFYEAR